MIARSVGLLLLGTSLALGASGCKNDCQASYDTICEDQQECGFALECELELAECSEVDAEAWACLEFCAIEAPCEAFNGLSPDAATEYLECTARCGEVEGF
ncbi:MAG: hypothetical protein IPM79_33200 [Polyangiaceae bacterium]|jgi:hypothetical protein|nr:hypothetical protein [Polyangiaceae bacterium]MBK8942335.1 hypothetical protein [Polyangiaceae bacterium]